MHFSEQNSLMTAILPCNDLDVSERFYARLGLVRCADERPSASVPDTYRMLSDGRGAQLHLTYAVEDWLVPGRNPFGLYLHIKDVDRLAARFAGEIVAGPQHQPWGMYEFALSDPDQTLVRVGWPTRMGHT